MGRIDCIEEGGGEVSATNTRLSTAKIAKLPRRSHEQYSANDIACHPESVVGVLELRWDAGAGGAARDFNVMAPRASTRSAARTSFRSVRISFGRDPVVLR